VAVRREDNLFVFVVEVVEKVEKFLLSFFFPRDELDIIHDKTVEFSVFFLKTTGRIAFYRVYIVIQKTFKTGVIYFFKRKILLYSVAGGLDKVSFTETSVST
jgi:hypothetical protein